MKNSRPTTYRKSAEELRKTFLHLYNGLQLSCDAYDKGFKGEAARLAASIYIFVHDHGKKTPSLLTLLNRKGILFTNTAAPIDPDNLLSELPLVFTRASIAGIEYLPMCAGGPEVPPTEEKFSKWWDASVLRDNRRRILSRKNIVTTMRHQEGGGHVSRDLDESFADLQRHNTAGWIAFRENKAFAPEYGPHYATVRQIAHELSETLRRGCSDLIGSQAKS